MTKTIGVIGLGSIGMRHAKNLLSLGHTVTGFDPVYIGDGFPVLWPIRRLDELDAVVIASPTNLHAEHLILACNAGIDIFVEKPVADRRLDVNATMVGYNLRFHSCVKKAKEWLDAGLIGDPLWANFTCAQYNDKPAYMRDGVILNWSHEIDLALYLLGPAQVARQFTRVTDGKDDMTDIILLHEGRVSSTIHLDYLTEPEVRGFLIVGDKGLISADLVDRRIQLRQGKLITRFHGEDSFDENYVEEMQAFIDRIDGKETIGCTGAEALKVLEICLEVRKQAGLV